MAWEALNNIAVGQEAPPRDRRQRQRPLLRPDRRRPRRPPRLAAPHHRFAPRRAATKQSSTGRRSGSERRPRVGPVRLQDALHAMKKGIKDALAPQGLFEDLGMKYVGPVDGHDLAGHGARARPGQALRRPGDRARDHPRRATATRRPSAHEADQFHAVGIIDPDTGEPPKPAARVLDRRLRRRDRRRSASDRKDIVGITAAMLDPVGLAPLRRAASPTAPSTSASPSSTPLTSRRRPGDRRPAPGGRRLRDVPQPRLRPGADGRRAAQVPASRSCSTGPASPATTAPATTACGTCRSSRSCPGLRLAAPRDATRLREELREAVEVDDAPTVIRFPKGTVGAEVEAVERLHDGVDVLARRPPAPATTTC